MFALPCSYYCVLSNLLAVEFMETGRHNLRSFLAANLTQNYFLIAQLSFLWHSWQQCRIKQYATKCVNIWYRKWKEREEIKRKWGNVESESLSIFSPLSLSILSHSRCKNATGCTTPIASVDMIRVQFDNYTTLPENFKNVLNWIQIIAAKH